jgi:hypothetical protein
MKKPRAVHKVEVWADRATHELPQKYALTDLTDILQSDKMQTIVGRSHATNNLHHCYQQLLKVCKELLSFSAVGIE